MPSGVGAPNSIVSTYPSGPGVRSARVARSAAQRRRSAEWMDREVRCRGLASELLAWRAACLTLTGRDVVRLASFLGFSRAWSAGRGDLVRPRRVLWDDIFVSNTD